jgi:predicted MFS family arabinose efflux permease
MDAVTALARDYPVIEAVLLLTLLLKRYLWAALGCAGAVIFTFGVQLHNDYSPAVLFSARSLSTLAVQLGVALAAAAGVFLIKRVIWKAMKIDDLDTPKTD